MLLTSSSIQGVILLQSRAEYSLAWIIKIDSQNDRWQFRDQGLNMTSEPSY